MNAVDPSTQSSTARILENLRSRGEDEKLAKGIGDNLRSLEERYMKALSDPNSKNTEALGVEYNRAVRTYEAFQRLMQSAHEIMMRAIQGLGRG